MHLTELKQSDWVISALIINEFENNIESIASERKLLLTRAGKYNGIIFF